MYIKENIHTVCSVSRETLQLLQDYHDLLIKWQKAVNLISPNTINEIWHRHIADSMQVYNHIPNDTKTIADLGSGGGLPAIICAILAKDKNIGSNIHITMIESDKKKSLFLKECVRELKLNCSVLNTRIELSPIANYDLITARALANLPSLLESCTQLGSTKAIFLKGSRFKDEIKSVYANWDISVKEIPSITERNARMLIINDLKYK